MGPQGKIMKELRRQSGALIVLQQRSDMRPDQLRRGLTLTGTVEQIALAKRLIANCVSKDVLTERAAPTPSRLSVGSTSNRRGSYQQSPYSYYQQDNSAHTPTSSSYQTNLSTPTWASSNTTTPTVPTGSRHRPDPSLYSPQVITGRRSPSRSPPHSPPFSYQDEDNSSSVRKSPTIDLMLDMGGFRIARGPDKGMTGFRRARKGGQIEMDKHVPLKPLKSDENLLEEEDTSPTHVPLRPLIEPKVSVHSMISVGSGSNSPGHSSMGEGDDDIGILK
jgi:hypothetical protein